LTELTAAGISLSEIKPVKQTQTSQRWKFQVFYHDIMLPARLEFSRRNNEYFEESTVEPPSATLLAGHRVVPFVFNHYTSPAAYRQKINALATRAEVQARDVFDLYHLAGSFEAGKQAPAKLVARAMEQLTLISFDMLTEQVIPFLPKDLAEHYGTKAAWKAMSEKVRNNLLAVL